MCGTEYNETVAHKIVVDKGLLRRGLSLDVTMILTDTGGCMGPDGTSNRIPIKQDKVHSFGNQARMGEGEFSMRKEMRLRK